MLQPWEPQRVARAGEPTPRVYLRGAGTVPHTWRRQLAELGLECLNRTCIEKLPTTLVIQLKRFDYDWDRGEPVKFNDPFEFPDAIDMEPYTADGLARVDRDEQDRTADTGANVATSTATEGEAVAAVPRPYRLAGVVVHSGIANAGQSALLLLLM